jgi:prepilin-type N-terminal cleavage/methylation domain-containing protein
VKREPTGERGFTLIDLLVAIVVVGILGSVAIVGVSGLTSAAHQASCQATMDAARHSVAAYYAAQSPNAFPDTFGALQAQNDLTLHGGVSGTGLTLTSDRGNPPSWTITLTPATGALVASGADSANCN